jgi:hypothetical protein
MFNWFKIDLDLLCIGSRIGLDQTEPDQTEPNQK